MKLATPIDLKHFESPTKTLLLLPVFFIIFYFELLNSIDSWQLSYPPGFPWLSAKIFFDCYYPSPRRCRHTASLISGRISGEIKLRERVSDVQLEMWTTTTTRSAGGWSENCAQHWALCRFRYDELAEFLLHQREREGGLVQSLLYSLFFIPFFRVYVLCLDVRRITRKTLDLSLLTDRRVLQLERHI